MNMRSAKFWGLSAFALAATVLCLPSQASAHTEAPTAITKISAPEQTTPHHRHFRHHAHHNKAHHPAHAGMHKPVVRKQPTHLARLTTALKELANVDMKTGAPKNASESAGECAGHVVTALNRAGIPVTMADANKLEPELIKAGFQQVDMTRDSLQPGDVVMIAPTDALQKVVRVSVDKRGKRHEVIRQIDEAHRFGHVEIFTGKDGMISDFTQGDLAVPYKHRQHIDQSDITVLRHPVLAQEAQQEAVKPAVMFKEVAAADLARAKLGFGNTQYAWSQQASAPQNYNVRVSTGGSLLASYKL